MQLSFPPGHQERQRTTVGAKGSRRTLFAFSDTATIETVNGNSRTFIINNVKERSHCLIRFFPLYIQASAQI